MKTQKMKLSTAVLIAIGAFCKKEDGFTFNDVYKWVYDKTKKKEILIDDIDRYTGNFYWDIHSIFTDLFYNIFYTVFETDGDTFKPKKKTLEALHNAEKAEELDASVEEIMKQAEKDSQKNNIFQKNMEKEEEVWSNFVSSFEAKVIGYIEARQDAGKEPVTIKQIQSRFADYSIRCDEYVEILKELGYVLKKTGPISKWTINFDV